MPDTQITEEKIAKPLNIGSSINRILVIALVSSVVLGGVTGLVMASKSSVPGAVQNLPGQQPKAASQDNKTFRDFAEGTIKAKPQPKNQNQYTEGTHILERDGQVSVTLTSSVVDLSKYEGKKVKVLGETQKALQSGWLMDVGKVEEQ